MIVLELKKFNLYSVFCLVAIFFTANSLISQDLLPSSLNIFDKYRSNPAFGGLGNQKILAFGYRDQWTGLEAHPKQFYLSYNRPFYNLYGGGGISIFSETKGIKNIFQLKFSYNYVYSGYIGLISFGGALSVDVLSKNSKRIITPDGDYTNNGVYNYNDTYLESFVNNNSYFPGFSIFALYNFKNFEFGIVFDKKLNVAGVHYQTGNIIKLNWQYNKSITPEIYLKVFGLLYSDLKIIQNETSFVFNFKNALGGFGLRGFSKNTWDSFFFIAGGNINRNIKLIYGFDLSLSQIRHANSGVHEIKLIYNFGQVGKNTLLPPVIFNPRL